jgi:hypothetical protein
LATVPVTMGNDLGKSDRHPSSYLVSEAETAPVTMVTIMPSPCRMGTLLLVNNLST